MRRGQKDSVTPVHLLWDPGMKLNLTKNDDQGHALSKKSISPLTPGPWITEFQSHPVCGVR